jgi:hypothetical protein
MKRHNRYHGLLSLGERLVKGTLRERESLPFAARGSDFS